MPEEKVTGPSETEKLIADMLNTMEPGDTQLLCGRVVYRHMTPDPRFEVNGGGTWSFFEAFMLVTAPQGRAM